MLDAAYEKAGASIAADAAAACAGADVIAKVRRPLPGEFAGLKAGALVICIMDPFRAGDELAPLAQSGAPVFAMDLIPPLTRAQSMELLASPVTIGTVKA